jgi:hypothetical protein
MDHCWNRYLDDLAADTRFSDKLQSWMILQYARDICASTALTSACSDWTVLEPLTVPNLLEQLCAPECQWSSLPPPAVSWINTSIPRASLVSKGLFCSKRHDNAFCAAVTVDSAHGCDLLRNGCGDFYLAHQSSRMGPAAAAQQYSALQPQCLLEQPQVNSMLSLPPPILTLSTTPPRIVAFPIGRISRAEGWAIIGAALGESSSAVSGSGGTGGTGGTYFSRIEYNVTVGGAPYLVSGLLAGTPAKGGAQLAKKVPQGSPGRPRKPLEKPAQRTGEADRLPGRRRGPHRSEHPSAPCGLRRQARISRHRWR